MPIDRRRLYKLPWSKADNPGAWVEVTDACDLACTGCYRHQLQGHQDLEEVKRNILLSRQWTRCGRISIAGGEPLLYPRIIEVVDFIARHGMQPVIFTNGLRLDQGLAAELKKAGLHQIFIHIDSRQNRPGWEGKTESDLNRLRQRYADLIWDLGKVQLGINVTVYRETLDEIPSILEWVRQNPHKVQNVSLIPLRGLNLTPGKKYMARGRVIDPSLLRCVAPDEHVITLTSLEIYEKIEQHFPGSPPAAYLSGTSKTETYKFLIILYLGSPRNRYGVIGAKAVELDTFLFHLRNGRYSAGRVNPQVGKKVFLLAVLDREIRRAFGRFLRGMLKDPARLFDKIFIQCINIQQPNEILDGEVNLCEGCLNQMVYQGELIPSCQLDEYRLFGGPLAEIRD